MAIVVKSLSTPSKEEISRIVDNEKPVVIDFGIRTISNQNFSKIVALPKQALANCDGKTAKQVEISLVQENGEKYLKLKPIGEPQSKEDVEIE